MGLTLKDVKEISTAGSPLKDSVFIASTNIDTWASGPADAKPTAANGDCESLDAVHISLYPYLSIQPSAPTRTSVRARAPDASANSKRGSQMLPHPLARAWGTTLPLVPAQPTPPRGTNYQSTKISLASRPASMRSFTPPSWIALLLTTRSESARLRRLQTRSSAYVYLRALSSLGV